MTEVKDNQFVEDVKSIQELDIVPAILELICKTTGMGFSAVARVTDQHWIACAVRDEIDFGLKPMGELQIGTTICNEIRQHGQAVVIDQVENDVQYASHPTPAMYGFQSYISIPIFLKDGSFFGTLCAIDPQPRALHAGKMVTLFSLFADLISYHLLAKEQTRLRASLLVLAQQKLAFSKEEVRQLRHVSNHTLQEPLRKLQLFSDMLILEQSELPEGRIKRLASRINALAGSVSLMVNEIAKFTAPDEPVSAFQPVDLNRIVNNALQQLRHKIDQKGATVFADFLHTIPGVPQQLNQVFYYVLDNALTFSREGVAPVIKVYSQDMTNSDLIQLSSSAIHTSYCKVCIEDNGIGIHSNYISKIFDLFIKLNPIERLEGLGIGLSQSKKIVRNHDGAILVDSKEGEGTVFSLILPAERMLLPVH